MTAEDRRVRVLAVDHERDVDVVGHHGGNVTSVSGALSVLDFNGDGLPDFASRISVGEPGRDEVRGAYVVFGQRDTRPLVLDEFPGDYAGFVIPWVPRVFGSAPDLNGDGRDELILSNGTAPERQFFLLGATCS